MYQTVVVVVVVLVVDGQKRGFCRGLVVSWQTRYKGLGLILMPELERVVWMGEDGERGGFVGGDACRFGPIASRWLRIWLGE